MSLSKRLLEAREADINRELRLCAGCGERIASEYEGVRHREHAEGPLGPFTTIWLCDCQEITEGSCLRCEVPAEENGPTLCPACLAEYQGEIRDLLEEAECWRCGGSPSVEEYDPYEESGLCGWCAHQAQKELGYLPAWTLALPELPEESRRVITPEEFRAGKVELVTDPRIIQYLADHPDDLHDLTPRQFEELIAELLRDMGYEAKLGPRGRDGGIDVYAERALETGPELVFVQCKRYREDNKVAQSVVKQLFADVTTKGASRGLIVTTSSFTGPALGLINEQRYRLSGADRPKVEEWLREVRAEHT